MGHNLGIRVLAEGVEDEDAICLALKSNVNLFQGYYFSRPVFELDTFLMDKIIVKMNDIGTIFRRMTLDSINKKRDLVNNYNLLSNKIIEQFAGIFVYFLQKYFPVFVVKSRYHFLITLT